MKDLHQTVMKKPPLVDIDASNCAILQAPATFDKKKNIHLEILVTRFCELKVCKSCCIRNFYICGFSLKNKILEY